MGGAHRIVPFACSPGSPPMWHQQHPHQLTSGQSRLCNKLQSTFDLDLTPESHHHFLITCILCHEAIWNGIILVGAPSPRGFGGEHVAQPRSRAVKIPPKAPGYFLLSQVRCRHRDQIQLAGEKTAQALESNLTSLEKKIDDLLASFEESERAKVDEANSKQGNGVGGSVGKEEKA